MAASVFHRAIGPAIKQIPKSVVDFHASGGVCEGVLRVTRGPHLAGLVARLGRLPPPTSPGSTAKTRVESTYDPETNSVHWVRDFPGNCRLRSRWYYHEGTSVAVDSFEYMGIKDFAAFGFDLVACEGPTPDSVGFKHITRSAWIMGVPVPLWMALTADGASIPHEDGEGWSVEVRIHHVLLGDVTGYSGDVRLVEQR